VTGVNSPFNVSLLTKQDRQSTYKCKIEAGSCNNCCRGKAIIIMYSECVSVAVIVKHSMLIRHIVICVLSRSTDSIFSSASF